MKLGWIMVVGAGLLSGCDQMGGSKGDSGGMGSQSDRAFEEGKGGVERIPGYESGASVSEPTRTTNQSNPGSPSGGTAGWPDEKQGRDASGRVQPQ